MYACALYDIGDRDNCSDIENGNDGQQNRLGIL